MALTNPTTAQSVASSMLGPRKGKATRWRATSCSYRSYIFLRSELHLARIELHLYQIGAFLTELTHKRRLSPLTGFGSCAPHLKVVWLDVWVQVDWNWFPDFVCSNTCSAAHQFVSTPCTLLGPKFKPKFRFWKGVVNGSSPK